jgi:hypothetical protein
MKRFCALLCALMMFSLLLGAPSIARAQDQGTAEITSPRTSEVIFGSTPIIGTARHPDFVRYRLEFASLERNSSEYFLITEIRQQVTAGILASWDTTTIPDGRYQLRLRLILRDGSVIDSVVNDINVRNSQPTPLPTVPIPATPIPTIEPTPGPSPTSLIQQPPTNTPRAPQTQQAAVVEVPPDDSGGASVDAFDSALQSAFLRGIIVAALGFAAFGAYRVAAPYIRPTVRRTLRRVFGR